MPRYIIRFEKGSFGYDFHTYFDNSSLQNTSLNGCVLTLDEVNNAIDEILKEDNSKILGFTILDTKEC